MEAYVEFDLQDLPFPDAIALLSTEGYSCRHEAPFDEEDEDATYYLIIVCGGDDIPEGAKLYKEVGFDVMRFRSWKEADSETGVVACGGHYTCAALYERRKKNNSSKAPRWRACEHCLGTTCPSGTTPLNRRSSDESKAEEGKLY